MQSLSNETASEVVPGLVIPETVVILHQATHWYSYSDDGKCILRKPPAQMTTDVLYRAMTHRAGEPGQGDIVAQFWCERQDAAGTLVTVEYFDDASLRQFLELKPNRAKLGVLMQFIAPPVGNQPIYQFLVGSENGTTVSIERHICKARYVDITLGPCQRCNCLPITAAVGKLRTATAPYSPSECLTVYDEIVNPAFHTHFGQIMSCLSKQLGSSKLLLLMQLDPLTQGLLLIGVLAAEIQTSRKNITFELLLMSTDLKRATAQMVTAMEQGDPAFDLGRPIAGIGSSGLEATTPASFSNARPASSRPIGSSLKKTPRSPAALEHVAWTCPNCNDSEDTSPDLGRVTICLADVVAFHDHVYKEQMRALKDALHTGATAELAPDAVVVPLLLRMNVPVHEIRSRKVWRDKDVNVCKRCSEIFLRGGASLKPRPPPPPTPRSPCDSKEGAGTPTLQHAKRETSPNKTLPEDLSLRNKMVFTLYQGLHRAREDRESLEKAYTDMKKQYSARAARLAQEGQPQDGLPVDPFERLLLNPSEPENALDVPYCVVLMNELKLFTEVLCGGDVHLPNPPVVISVGRSLDDVHVQEERLRGAGVYRCREQTVECLAKGSSILKQLTAEERTLLLEVVDW